MTIRIVADEARFDEPSKRTARTQDLAGRWARAQLRTRSSVISEQQRGPRRSRVLSMPEVLGVIRLGLGRSALRGAADWWAD
ncbi:MAG: hypothetical protein IH818_04385 [Acidobacteria bacterium]|nr:hypothetical protein [Acidobacteriota bacterium]